MTTSHHALPADATIGDRLRRLRNKRGLTQEQLAELADVSADVVRKLEQGSRSTARLTTLTKLAEALGVPRSHLIDGRPQLDEADGQLVLDLRDVILSPELLPGIDLDDDIGAPTNADELWRLVRRGWADYWRGDFLRLAQSLPGLIGEARVTEWSAGAAAAGPLTQAYQLAGLLLVQLGQENLATVAVERGLLVSLRGDDELQHATLYGTYAWALLNQGRNTEAEKLAVRAAARFEPKFSTATPEHLTVWGRILLYASRGAAGDGRVEAALDHGTLAKMGAARFQRDQRAYGDSFGLTRVAVRMTNMHAVLGQPDKALAAARDVRRDDLYTTTYAGHLLDVAQAQSDMHRRDQAAVTLKKAKDLAPVWYRHQPEARSLTDHLAERQTRLSPVVRELVRALDPPLNGTGCPTFRPVGAG